MSDLSRDEILQQVYKLFNKAAEEERNYNWKNAIAHLEEAKKITSEQKYKELSGDANYRLGEIYQMAANFEKIEEDVLKSYQLSISSFQRAHNIFKELNNVEKINATMGFINFLKYIIEFEKGNEEFLLYSAKNHFKEAKLINLKSGKLIDSLKMVIFESIVLNLIIGEKIIRLDEQTDFKELALEHDNLTKKIWEELKNQQDFPEIYLQYYLLSIVEFCHITFAYLPADNLIKKQYLMDNRDIVKEFIEKFENSDKTLCLFNAYSIYSVLHLFFSVLYVDNQFLLKKVLKTSQNSIKKAEILLQKINANQFLTLFYFVRFSIAVMSIYLGYFSSDFKRIMDDLDRCIDSISLYFPKIMVANVVFVSAATVSMIAINPILPDKQRIDFSKKSADLINRISIELSSIVMNPNYKIYNLTRDIALCANYALIGDLTSDIQESSKYLQMSSKIFNNIFKYNIQRIQDTYYYTVFLMSTSRAAIFLAKNSSIKSEIINYYQEAIKLLLQSKKQEAALLYIDHLFLLGDIYYELGRLTDDDKLFNQSYSTHMDTIEYCKNKGYFNLVGSSFVKVAQIEDRLGNFLSAAENYKNAIDSFDQAIMTLTYTKLGKRIEKLKNYVNAWRFLEIAKSYHANEDHYNAQLNYEQGSYILKDIREYKFESPFYFAWSTLEKAEKLSKTNKHEEAAASYLVAKFNFQEAIEILNSALKKRKTLEEIDRISKLIQVAEFRVTYCIARQQIENARLESKSGNHLLAAELYSKASGLFENISQTLRTEREKEELTAIFYLCRAWENMERAEVEQKPSLYGIASDLFKDAGTHFLESRMKKLSIGNSLYCSALEYGSRFDQSIDLMEKTDYYKKIKMYLRESSKQYQLGGFKQDAQWALATSTFFDGIWHLIQSDNEMDFSKKNQFLNIALNYLNNALEIFGNAGYKQKRDEILKHLKMIKDEKAILTSALNLIEKPAISASSVGISAPVSPNEISSSIDIDEMQRTDLTTESELNWPKRIHQIYFIMSNGTCIYSKSFREVDEVEPQLVAGGLTGITAFLQELTLDKTKVRIVEQEEATILFEHGKYVSVALITDENLITLQNKLKELIQIVEEFFEDEFKTYSGDMEVFSKIDKFVQKIFEI
ncbi:MAG: hypothetical protein HWN67_16960 [Candidatus Helarchaeota archaeon]|nr:hypothetical protein [Candidatus Helarchaeota archaeon]